MSWTLELEYPMGRQAPIRRYRGHQGLGLITLVDRGAPIVSYQTWYRVGSRNERPGKTGIAHLFEHLMFNQTTSLAPGEFDRLIERTGGDCNAATWVDWTFYRDSVPTRDLELVVRLEADRMHNLVLESAQLEAEREVVSNERMEHVDNDVDGFLFEELFRLAFSVHPYHWPTIGWMEDIRSLSLDDIHAFYRTYYAPNNATIIAVGDFDEPTLLDAVERGYGAIPPAVVPGEAGAPEPAQAGERRHRVALPVAAERAVIGYRAPAQGDPDWAALELISTLLTGGPSSRLYRRLVVDLELATSVMSTVTPSRDPGLFELSINVSRGKSADKAMEIVDEEMARLAEEPVAAAELAKAKHAVETGFWAGLATVDSKAEAFGHYQTALGDFRALFATAALLTQIEPDDIARAAGTHLCPEGRTVVVAEPEDPAEAGLGGEEPRP